MTDWKIWYGDSSTFSSDDGSPFDAPRLNVQCIAGADPNVGRYIIGDQDAYWWEAEEGRWRGGDRRGEWDYLCRIGPRVVLYGRQIPDAAHNACLVAAKSDPDLPPKSAGGRGERLND